MSSTKDKKLVGRPKQSPINKLQVKLWYLSVKQQSGMSDYRLDMLFGQPEGPIDEGGAGRNRVFGLFKKGVFPSRGNHWRREFDIVDRVNQKFPGTSNIIDTPLWELLNDTARNHQAINKITQKCLTKLGLMKLSGEVAYEWSCFAAEELDGTDKPSLTPQGASKYEMSLKRAIKNASDEFTHLALFGSLYIDSYLSFDLEKTDILANFFNSTVAQICDEGWMGSLETYFRDIVTQRILYFKREYLPPENLKYDLNKPPINNQDFIVSKDDEKYRFFLNNFSSIKFQNYIRSLSKLPDDMYESLLNKGKISAEENQLVQNFKNRGV